MRSHRKLARLLAALAIALFATRARAQCGPDVPCVGNSTIPSLILLVGTDGAGTPDPLGQFAVVIRDLANNPEPGVIVDVDFSGASDLRIASLQPGASVDCAGHKVSGVTDATGTCTFRIVGSAVAGAPPSAPGAVHVRANGNLLGSPTVAAFDLDGMGGAGAMDLSLWLGDFVSGSPAERADYDGSGAVGAGDLSLWLGAFGAAGSAVSGARCP